MKAIAFSESRSPVGSSAKISVGSFIKARSAPLADLLRRKPFSGRERIVRVALNLQHKEILDNICLKLGQSESETMRVAFLEYAKSISLIAEKVHRK
jgi:hypothetical protein